MLRYIKIIAESILEGIIEARKAKAQKYLNDKIGRI